MFLILHYISYLIKNYLNRIPVLEVPTSRMPKTTHVEIKLAFHRWEF